MYHMWLVFSTSYQHLVLRKKTSDTQYMSLVLSKKTSHGNAEPNRGTATVSPTAAQRPQPPTLTSLSLSLVVGNHALFGSVWHFSPPPYAISICNECLTASFPISEMRLLLMVFPLVFPNEVPLVFPMKKSCFSYMELDGKKL